MTRRSTLSALCGLVVLAYADTPAAPLPPASVATAAPVMVPPPPPASGAVVLVGAGDIADCDSRGDEATAALLDSIAGTVFTAGDNAYSDGSAEAFAHCYQPSWGRHKARTRPSPGNHDYETED